MDFSRGCNCKIMTKYILMSQINSNVGGCKDVIFLVYFMILHNKNAIRGKYLEAIGQTASPLTTQVFRSLDRVA